MDYGGFSETLTFDTCETRCCVNVSIVEDLVDEPDEIFDYSLEPTGSGLDPRITITPDTGEVVISDNDGKKVKMLRMFYWAFFSLDSTINCWLSMTSLLISQCRPAIRESVDSLCRDGADTPMPPYIGKAFICTNVEELSLFRYLIMVCE